MDYNNIPQELKDLDRWVVWREGKIPYDAKLLNSRASSTNHATWSTFDEAVTAYEECDLALGLGFVLNGDGLVGVDLDHVVHDGVPDPVALELLDHLDCAYIGVSPSGTGLRAFGYSVPLLQGCKGQYEGIAVELYSSQRYLTITDHAIKLEPLRELKHFSDLAHYIRSSSHINTVTGEVIERKPNERHSELVRRILTGTTYHDSLRDLAASLAASGMHQGALVNHLRGLMDASSAPRDQRYHDRYKQIPDLVRTASNKYKIIDPFQELEPKEEGDLFESLGAVFADELPTTYEVPNEIVEGLLVARNTSILYGESNSGKSFFALNMAAAVSRGADFLGMRTQQGCCIYLATESAESVRTRLQAYQRYYNCKLDNLMVVQRPVNFFNDDIDVERVIELIKLVEERKEQRVSLVIADTLSRISSGAEENSGASMQPVLGRFERIMLSTTASVMMVHHQGKMATNGARGWSGIKAFVDSELHVSEEEGIRKVVPTKQRSLSTKGTEIYFRLEPINIGYSVFGKPMSTCIVTQ